MVQVCMWLVPPDWVSDEEWLYVVCVQCTHRLDSYHNVIAITTWFQLSNLKTLMYLSSVVIESSPIWIWLSGTTSSFDENHFRLLKSRLSPHNNGVPRHDVELHSYKIQVAMFNNIASYHSIQAFLLEYKVCSINSALSPSILLSEQRLIHNYTGHWLVRSRTKSKSHKISEFLF